MKIGKLGYVTLAMLLAGTMACSDDGGGGGDDGGDDGAGDDGTGDDGTGDDGTGDDGTDPDAGGDGADGSTACLGEPTPVANEMWPHVAEGTEITYLAEPPASGPHYPVWATWAVHGVVPRGYWIHNVEHGGIVLLHSPDASEEVVTALTAAYDAIPVDEQCGHKRAMVATDAPLTTPVAVIAADVVMEGECVDQDAILQFVTDYRGQGPEAECDEGTFVGK